MMDFHSARYAGHAAIVALVLLVAPPVLAQNDGPTSSRRLSADFMAAHAAGDYGKAVEIGKRWVALKPKDTTAAYNLACAYALHGDEANALVWLRKSVDNGWSDVGHMKRDADLKALVGTPAFEAVVAMAEERARPQLEAAAKSVPLVIPPSNYDSARPTPLIVALHGYGGEASRFSAMWKDVADDAGAILAVPRAVRTVVMGGYSWGRPEEAEIIVNTAIERVAEKYNVDAKRIVLTGFSQGGHMAFFIGLKHPEKFRGVIPVAGSYDPGFAPLTDAAARAKTRFHLMVGADDNARNVESNRQAEKDLRAAGIDVTLTVYPDLGHAFPKNRAAELGKALRAVLEKP